MNMDPNDNIQADGGVIFNSTSGTHIQYYSSSPVCAIVFTDNSCDGHECNGKIYSGFTLTVFANPEY